VGVDDTPRDGDAPHGEHERRDDRGDGRRRDDRERDGGRSRSRERRRRSRSPSNERRRRSRSRSRSRERGRYGGGGGDGGGGGYRRDGYSGGGYRGGRAGDWEKGGPGNGGGRHDAPGARGGDWRVGKSREELELLELTRDARTVFVSQLVVKATEADIRAYFERIGGVAGVVLIRDKPTGKSKGCGYIEFTDLETVAKALLLNGQRFCTKHPACSCSGFPLALKPSEAEKNYAAAAEAQGGSSLSAGIEKRVYLCNLRTELSEGDIRPLVTVFGGVDRITLVRDERTGASRGYGYAQFSTPESAAAAVVALHGFDLGDRRIHAGRLDAMGSVVAHNGETMALDDGYGHALSAQARAALIAQLSSATSAAVMQLGAGLQFAAAAAAMPAHPAPSQTRCVRLFNLFSPAEEDATGLAEIGEDVTTECSKVARVLNSRVDATSPDGAVFVMFADAAGAAAAAAALAGRAFGGRTIQCEFAPEPRL
jgi:RNA-binding protein 39